MSVLKLKYFCRIKYMVIAEVINVINVFYDIKSPGDML